MFKILKTIHQDLKDFLADLQQADDERKKFWLVVATSLTMVVVIVVWFINFKNLVTGQPAKSELTKNNITENKPQESSNESFWRIFGRGLKISFRATVGFLQGVIENISSRISQGLNFLEKQIKKTNDFSFPGASLNFVLEKDQPIPPTPLP